MSASVSARWRAARELLDGLPCARGLNMAHEAVDRHASGPAADRTALRFLRAGGAVADVTYAALREETNRFANALEALGVGRGEVVFSLLGRRPELYTSLLGTLKRGAVFCPLFAAFGPEPVAQRLTLGDGRVLVTTAALYRRKVAPVRDRLPGLRHVLLVDGRPEEGTRSWHQLVTGSSDRYDIPPTAEDDPALLHFTSGTTGTPKGALHVHGAVVAHHLTGRTALDLRPGDTYWCTADPGWVTGTSYGVLAPLTNAVTTVVDEDELDAARWHAVLEQQRVAVWYTAPTALRMLKRSAARPPQLPQLRHIASVGEPLDRDLVLWTQDVYGVAAHDTWWQTETGAIMIANRPGTPVRPGSMGRALPGVTADVVERDDDGPVVRNGRLVPVRDPSAEGELVLRPDAPSMFRGYLHEETRFASRFLDGWYLTGDLVRRDGDGYFWFVGRGDDVIKSAGHLIGPFEVESALHEHPAVHEAGVVGRPDPVAGAVVVAFVSLVPPYEPSDALRLELLGHARKRLGPAVAPRDIRFLAALPTTPSGKVVRRDLRVLAAEGTNASVP